MQISKLLSTLMKDLAQQAKKGSAASNSSASNSKGLGNAATFQNQTPGGPQHMVYGRSGQLMRLGTLQSQLNIRESTFAALLAQKWNRAVTQFNSGAGGGETQAQALSPRQLDALAATLLQQSFDLIQELFKRDKKEQRKYKKNDQNEDEESEKEAQEQALDLLETLLEYADDADNIQAFCKWAEDSIQRSKQEIEKRINANQLPESTQRMFSIMEDAVEALQHGVEPTFIYARLKEEINSP